MGWYVLLPFFDFPAGLAVLLDELPLEVADPLLCADMGRTVTRVGALLVVGNIPVDPGILVPVGPKCALGTHTIVEGTVLKVGGGNNDAVVVGAGIGTIAMVAVDTTT